MEGLAHDILRFVVAQYAGSNREEPRIESFFDGGNSVHTSRLDVKVSCYVQANASGISELGSGC